MTLFPLRDIVKLDGVWDFCFLPDTLMEEVDEKKVAFDSFAAVPGNFDVLPETLYKRGCGVYRRSFTLGKPFDNALLRIGGIGLRGRLLIDGREVGYINLSYSAVSFETGPLAAGEHEIIALIDNNFSPEKMKLFLPFYDFYAFGGFHRSIDLVSLPKGTVFDRIQVSTVDYREGKVRLRVLFRSTPASSMQVRFDTEKEFHSVSDGDVLTVPDFRLWSPEFPALHSVEVRAGEDCIVESFGIREIRTCENTLLLNGAPLYLRGFNRHEAHAVTGAATTEQMMLEDLQNLKALNCNFIRGSHYPQSQAFLDLCDRAGVLVWEESLGWGNTREQLCDPEFMVLQEEQTRLMVRNSFNHPSVIIWGFLNEFNSETAEGKALCAKLMDAIHEEDSTRPATFASCHAARDICFDLVDIVAFNTYPGWIQDDYAEEPPEAIGPDLERILSHCRKFGKPIMVSEMGCCGLYGEHDRAAGQWSEEFQAEYLAEVIRQVFACSEICGLTIWQMNDAKSYHRKGANIRCKPLAYNLAGVFDAFRRPKLAAETVRNGFQTP